MRKPKETHLWFVKGDDEIQVESHCKELNKAILDLKKVAPEDVYIIYDEEPGFLRCAVKLTRLTFRTIKPPTDKEKKAKASAGKTKTTNLKYQNLAN